MRQTALNLCVVLCLMGGLAATDANAATREEAVSEAIAADGGGGRVLSVKEEKSGDKRVWAVKVITDGRVRVHRIPAD